MSGEFMQKAKDKSEFVTTDGLNLSIWREKGSAVCERSPAHQVFVNIAFCRRGDLESMMCIMGKSVCSIWKHRPRQFQWKNTFRSVRFNFVRIFGRIFRHYSFI
jgi:hypothetical protein